METRASPFIVGLFTIAVLAGALAAVFWVGRYGDTAGLSQYRIVFSDDVTGLSRGSSVMFSGIRVGEVVELVINPQDPSQVIATVRIDTSVPLTDETTAQLQFQGITGVGFIQLRPGAADARPLADAWGDRPGLPEITAERSTFQNIMDGAQSLLTRLDDVAGRIDGLVRDNEAAVTATLRNAQTFTAALAENADSISGFLADAAGAARQLERVGQRVELLAEGLEPVIAAIDPESVRATFDGFESAARDFGAAAGRVESLVAANEDSLGASIRNVETFTAALAENSRSIEVFMTNASAAAARLDEVGQRIEAVVADLGPVIESVDPDTVRAIVRDVGAFTAMLGENSQRLEALVRDAGEAGARFNRITERFESVGDDVSRIVQAVDPDVVSRTVANAEEFTGRLAARGDDFDRFMTDAGAVASNLRESSQRLDEVLVRVDNMVGEEGGSVFTDVSEAARSFRALADNLNSRLDVVLADVERFGGGGLREFQQFMTEGRRTLGDLDRVIGSLERDPRGFFFGGSRVPEYTPGRRF